MPPKCFEHPTNTAALVGPAPQIPPFGTIVKKLYATEGLFLDWGFLSVLEAGFMLLLGESSDVDHGLVARARILAEQELGPRRR